MKTAKLIGAAGVGKTTEILRIMTLALGSHEVAGDPTRLGFTTLTRIGRAEAATRAARDWGVPVGYLEKEGYFRTTHSIAFRAVGASSDEIIGGGDHDEQAWFEKRLGAKVATTFDDDGIVEFEGDRDCQAALMAWHLARARLQPLNVVIQYLYATGAYLPPPGEVLGIVQRYEDAKQRDRRIDFDDLLGRFAGIRFSVAGPEQCEPDGAVPDEVVGWFFDEAQDSSALLVAAQKRLLTGASVQWCWISADPLQAVHTWNGADPSLFLNWPADKERQLSQSYRCPEPIVKLGERCLRRLGNAYFDRKVMPAAHAGEVCSMYDVEDAIDAVSPSTSTLVLARTNKHVRRIEAMLAERDVPFDGIKPDAEPNSKKQARAALFRLSQGEKVSTVDIGPILHLFNYKAGDTRLLADGCRDAWKKRHPKPDSVRLQDLGGIGATDDLIAAIASGKWTRFDPPGQDFVRVAEKWGAENVLRPKVKVGTIHASKGTEADHVVFCAGSSRPIYEQKDESKDRYHEECRLEYTAVTRARYRLTIAPDLRSKFQMDIVDLV